MTRKAEKRSGGFSLLELVLVVVIIGTIAAIAIPRLSRGADGASEGALRGSLAVLRKAIDMYATEHGGTLPDQDEIEDQFLQYTDANGNTQATRDGTYLYGPYIASLPALPVGSRKGNTRIAGANGDGVGWIYDGSTGEIRANTEDDEKDATDVKYKDY